MYDFLQYILFKINIMGLSKVVSAIDGECRIYLKQFFAMLGMSISYPYIWNIFPICVHSAKSDLFRDNWEAFTNTS